MLKVDAMAVIFSIGGLVCIMTLYYNSITDIGSQQVIPYDSV